MIKKYALALLVLLSVCSLLSAQEPVDKVKRTAIQLDSTVANIGTFPKSDSKKTVVYTFKNAGTEKLVFYDAAPDCGCLTVQFPEKPVKPGKKGKIIVHYDGHRKTPASYNHRINIAYKGATEIFQLRLRFVMTEK